MASERHNAEFTAFVSNLPFNVSVDELREKFKHVSCSLCHSHPLFMSLSPSHYVTVTCSLCHCYPLYVIVTLSLCHCDPLFMSLPLSLYVIVTLSICCCHPLFVSHSNLLSIYVLVVTGYSVGILLIFNWLKNTFEGEHVSLVM